MTKIKNCLALAFVLLSPTAANALLIEGLCDGTADATVTCDTDTGLEWLDFGETQIAGLTPNAFLLDVGGFISDGWSIATGLQVETLLLNAGFIDVPGLILEEQIPVTHLVLELLGTTTFDPNTGGGFAVENTEQLALISYEFVSIPSVREGGVVRNICCFHYDSGTWNWGIWASREGAISVPEPGTLALLSLTLAALGISRRSRIT